MTSIRPAHSRQDLLGQRAGHQGLGAGDNREKETIQIGDTLENISHMFCKLIGYGFRRRRSVREDIMFYLESIQRNSQRDRSRSGN